MAAVQNGFFHISTIVHTPHVPLPQECMKHILFCSWDLSEHEKWISPSLNLDGLPVGRHFQNGSYRK